MPSEAELVIAAQQGDLDAFTELYERWLDPIYDFCMGMLRSRADASDVVQDTFLKAMQKMSSLKDPSAFKGWLYSIARNTALSRIRERGRTTAMPDDWDPPEAAVMAGAVTDPSEAAESGELRELVWAAAATLNPADASVYDMVVRQGLNSAEVGVALGVSPNQAYTVVHRMKESVEDALGAVVLAQTGRTRCPELDEIVERVDDPASPLLRKRVNRHAKKCELCGESKKRVPVPAVFAGSAWAAPDDLRQLVRARLRAEWGTDSGGPVDPPSGASRPRKLAGISALVAAAIIVALGSVVALSPEVFEALTDEPASANSSPSAPPVFTDLETAPPVFESRPSRTESPGVRQTPKPTLRPRPTPTVEPKRTPNIIIFTSPPKSPTPRPTITPCVPDYDNNYCGQQVPS